MRIVASNPDGAGDFILRQPAYAALLAAGHELTLIVRAHSVPLADMVAPGARTLVLDRSPYHRSFDASAPAIQKLLHAVREFSPDLFLIAPQTWTAFEEALSRALPALPVHRMRGSLFGAGKRTFGHTPQRETVAPVDAGIAEWKKSAQLVGTLLNTTVASPPRIAARLRDLDAARSRLRELGAGERPFLIACAAQTSDNVRGWTESNWAAVLRWAVEHFGVDLVFVGWTREHASTEMVRSMMGESASRTFNACDDQDDMAMVTGLAALSRGYIGRDTGPMHVAAALGKPVMAVFAGMHWPRFIPVARTGAAVTVKMHCANCGYGCKLPEPYCISLLTPDAVIEVLRRVRLEAEDGLTVHELEAARLATPEVLARIERDERERSAKRLRLMWPSIIQHASRDERFRQRLVDDPKRTLAEMGVRLPAGQVVAVLEDSAAKAHVVVPLKDHG